MSNPRRYHWAMKTEPLAPRLPLLPDSTLEYASRLWLRTALLAWMLGGALLAAVLCRAG